MGTGGPSTRLRRKRIRSHDHDHGRPSRLTTRSQLSTYVGSKSMENFQSCSDQYHARHSTRLFRSMPRCDIYNLRVTWHERWLNAFDSLGRHKSGKGNQGQKIGGDPSSLSMSSPLIRPDPVGLGHARCRINLNQP